ncbi:bifunctional phosphopantothenoylcysteine decarboxylase/phosphopantothenate--cysteine ligase CoaBC [Aquibacillus albus]|uniref:Coenzyme A biosynthesis bifunctional protein CoaBC n=1 Tax=Aquibacillus albus TaxID=1168171 RepID=A0ABS2N104_9BACI|nr:bifunctional phosphopantothenoylcysteine decarboxylase/phosphopantothenate--cysteine ligase CoaBC [Aquibacillus albus]MBM7571771.1 phosphopantothenoylcysteine decarboxylase/phosphopantothenate--cysteine ligase [Aquibacillus albus]
MLEGKRVVLGVTGGIAAYKACALTSKLTQKGAEVKVIMTESAMKFVAPLTFQALSRNPVYTNTFDEKDPEKIGHIDIADWADLFIIAPATANMIGKISNGIADDMLSTTLLATQATVYIAPAMNVNMYGHPAVKRNMQTLEEWGYRFIEPGEGYLACGWVGKGRLEEPETMIEAVEKDMESSYLLKGKKVLISAGPTREKIDPVRFFTNHSTGKMGFALAEEAARLGAEVTLVSGPVQLETPRGVYRVNVTSAAEMYDQMLVHYPGKDIVIKSAAVADYRPVQTFDKKLKKQKDQLAVEMERTTDILKELGNKKDKQYLVGFAAETNDVIDYGKTKLVSKNLDAIVINDVTVEGAGFASDTNQVIYLNSRGIEKHLAIASKKNIARKLFELINEDLKDEPK